MQIDQQRVCVCHRAAFVSHSDSEVKGELYLSVGWNSQQFGAQTWHHDGLVRDKFGFFLRTWGENVRRSNGFQQKPGVVRDSEYILSPIEDNRGSAGPH
eukprot:1077870-Rhodomonas_salina.1